MRLADPATCGRASPPVTEAAARCLWNLAISDRNKLRIAQHGGVAALVALARDGATVGAKEAAAGALRNLSYENDDARSRMVACGAVDTLLGMEEVSETASKHAVALLKHVADLDACRPMVAKALHLRWRDATIDIIRATIDAHFREAIVAQAEL